MKKLLIIIMLVLVLGAAASLVRAQIDHEAYSKLINGCIDNDTEASRICQARVDIEMTLKSALRRYELDNGMLPSTQQGLAALLEKPSIPSELPNWNGPYLEEIPLDPWSRAYQYIFPSPLNKGFKKYYSLFSWGQDGIESGDDISNRKLIEAEMDLSESQVLDETLKNKVQEKLSALFSEASLVTFQSIDIHNDWLVELRLSSSYQSLIYRLAITLESSALFDGKVDIETQESDGEHQVYILHGKLSSDILDEEKLKEGLQKLKGNLSFLE